MYENIRVRFGAPALLPGWVNKRLEYDRAPQRLVHEGYLTLLQDQRSWQIKYFQLTYDRIRYGAYAVMLLTPGRQCAIRSADLLTFFFPPSGWCRYSKIKGAEVEGEIVFKLGTLFMLQEVEEGIDREALAAGNNHVHVFKVQHGTYSLVLEANCREDMEEWVSGDHRRARACSCVRSYIHSSLFGALVFSVSRAIHVCVLLDAYRRRDC
jgi:hypothetical protein